MIIRVLSLNELVQLGRSISEHKDMHKKITDIDFLR